MYCNPLNLEYGFQHYGKYAHREGADPTLLYFKGKYYMFVSMCGGFYYSDDLEHWKFHRNATDMYRYAPDVREIDGYLVFSASSRMKPSTFWKTADPLSDKFEMVSEPFDFWDPNLFQDDDGKVYLYWGCACNKPIYAREMDPQTLLPMGEIKEVISPDVHSRGWERPTVPYERRKRKSAREYLFSLLMKIYAGNADKYPYFEGAFMTKINDKYYLQYAAPATESCRYGNGTFVGDSPLGPFTYQKHNPFSLKTGGFIKGAGHGSTIFDEYGNLWHAATMTISVNANFERRCGLFPAGIDKDGILFCNQNFADYPLEIPKGRFEPWAVEPKWMLLSYKKSVKVSSVYKQYLPEYSVDENICTCWCASESKGEWLQIDLGEIYEIGAIQLNLADVEVPIIEADEKQKADYEANRRYIDIDHSLYTRYIVEGSLDEEDWFIVVNKSESIDNLPNDFIELQSLQKMRFIRVTAIELPYNERFAISGLRVFGKGNGIAPKPVEHASGKNIYDDQTAKISWEQIDDAIGYNIRYGIAPDKLYLSHMQYEKNEVVLGSFNSHMNYYFTIDSFNESGITKGRTVYRIDKEGHKNA